VIISARIKAKIQYINVFFEDSIIHLQIIYIWFKLLSINKF